MTVHSLPFSLQSKLDALLNLLRGYGSCAVAFSGGLDSSVLAKAALAALGDRAVAFTATGPTMPAGESEAAVELARAIGIRHEVVPTDELADPRYQANPSDRCYYCKQTICGHFLRRAEKLGLAVLVDGANVDDAGDYRPGMRAARELGVRSPLAECGFGKRELRELARHWSLPTHDKPASPCLASRVAYGVSITPERLAMIDRAERFLHERGFRVARVRLHENDLARVEVPWEDLPRLLEPDLRRALAVHLRECGFRYATIDLEGFRSGSMNS
ncbi:MAG TPA: ATP-dependent sacrificial sulfur transferase LarE [Thermoguttaceae bacterium]|nr:ATP-dependent sacrificial sulfur transferase LarE [Thermoguttaceae bacterium]